VLNSVADRKKKHKMPVIKLSRPVWELEFASQGETLDRYLYHFFNLQWIIDVSFSLKSRAVLQLTVNSNKISL
jgi:hypothetical protein